MEAEATPAGQTLASYLRILRRRAWILVLCLVLIPVAAVFFAQRGTKLYTSSAEIYANEESFSPALTGIQATSGSQSENGAENMVYLALTPRVARRTLQALNRSDRSPDALLAQTSVGQKGTSDFFVVSVIDTDPTVAALLATGYARQIVRYKSELATAAIANARRLAARKLGALEAAGKENTLLYRSLGEKDQELEMLGALRTSRMSVVRTASRAFQIEPRPKRAAGFGIFLGLVVGAGLMFLIEALDTRVRSGTEIAERLDLPLLARIPAPPRKLARDDGLVMLAQPSGQHGESFRMLRTNLEFALLSGEARTILLASAVAKEGKSTIAANLAVALARGGRRVALVDLDLRRPHLNRFFRLPSTPGITDVALGRATLEAALTRVDLGTGLSDRWEREPAHAQRVRVARRSHVRSAPARSRRVRRHEPTLRDPECLARELRPRRDRLAADVARRRRDGFEHEGRCAPRREPPQPRPAAGPDRAAASPRLDPDREARACPGRGGPRPKG